MPSPVTADTAMAWAEPLAWNDVVVLDRVEQVDLFQTSRTRSSSRSTPRSARISTTLFGLGGRVGISGIAQMDDEIGLDHLFQRGAESRNEVRRQVGDEADRIREHDFGAVGNFTRRRVGSSVAKSMFFAMTSAPSAC